LDLSQLALLHQAAWAMCRSGLRQDLGHTLETMMSMARQALGGRSRRGGLKKPATCATEALANPSIKRFVDPADLAALAVCLASDHARSILGSTFPMDGDSPSSGG
jgi:NAD(P)-dependent dehydrogenase (short-subunit alcohol dehydrogenase family)